MQSQKEFRRIVGFVAVQFANLRVEDLPDVRARRGRRWKLEQVISVCLVGMMAGCKSLAEVEKLTATFSRAVRRQLGIPRRLADTTARDILCRIDSEALIQILDRAVGKAKASRALDRVIDLPFHMAAMDGKWTALPTWEGDYAQRHQKEDELPYGMMRTVTSTLATARGRPCIDVSPIPAKTNEMGHYPTALDALLAKHGRMLGMVSYDQGANSDFNARHTLARDLHYLMRMNDERRGMQQVAAELLDLQEVVATTEDVMGCSTVVTRTLRMVAVNRPGFPKCVRKSEIWDHARTLLRVDSQTVKHGKVIEGLTRYYCSSLADAELTPEQWLMLPRLHWSVELTHQTLDLSFEEDKRPWIVNDANGMLVVLILRRIAYTLLTLFRSVTLRSDEKRQRPWKELFQWLRDALIASTEATVASLRRRKFTVV